MWMVWWKNAVGEDCMILWVRGREEGEAVADGLLQSWEKTGGLRDEL